MVLLYGGYVTFMCYNETIERKYYNYVGDDVSRDARFKTTTEDVITLDKKMKEEDEYERCNQSDEGIKFCLHKPRLWICGVMVSALDCYGFHRIRSRRPGFDSPSRRNVYKLSMYFPDETLGKSPRVRAYYPRGATQYT